MMSSNSLMPLDLNEEDQSHQASSSSSSLPYPILFNPHHNHEQSLTDHDEAEKIEIPCGGSCINSKKENRSETNDEADDHQDDGSMKWMCSKSKTRMMRKMMVPELEQAAAPNSMPKFEEDDHIHEKQPAPSDNSSNTTSCSNHNHIISVRVCADCHTTKTPLWRSGPTGPKSLCNACGIRQRKARRAMAAAANGAGVAAKAGVVVKGNKLQNKQKKQELKKKGKVMGKKKFGFEDLALSLSNNLGLQQVFPQDEKEAAILLMALSYGLVHG